MFDLASLEEHKGKYKPLSAESRETYIQESIKYWLGIAPQFTTTVLYLPPDQREWMLHLGKLFLQLRREADAKLCFEQLFERRFNAPSRRMLTCDEESCTDKTLIGPFWMCANCIIRGVCNSCYQEREGGAIIKGCSSTHRYMEVRDGHWKNLKPGIVNDEGWTITRWVEERQKEFGVNNSGLNTAILKG